MTLAGSSIRNKILAVLALGIALVVAGALYGFQAARSGLATAQRVNETLIAQSIETQALDGAFKEQVAAWMSALVRGHDADALERAWKQVTFREREVRRSAEKLREAVQLPAARALLDKFLAAHRDMGERYRAALESFKSSGFDARKADAQVKGIEGGPAETLEELVKLMRDEAQAAVEGARRDANQALVTSLGVIGAATLAALLACLWLITRTVVNPLAYAVDVVGRVASGDLTVKVENSSADETGQLLAGLLKMRDGLADAVSRIRISADSVGGAAARMAAGHADLSSRTDQQAASLEETASSMEELETTVRQNADSARKANELAAGTSATASKGGEEMDRVVQTMAGISDSSRKIADILGVIDSIAFQTNILALNAAVEAARAGEQGRGFAVVAAEVRSLAQRSATAAKEIKELIQDSVNRVDQGKRLVEAAGNTMDEIVVSVQRVTEVMSGIAAASREQLAGIEQVSHSVTQMDRVVQQNAGLVAESAADAQHMSEQAAELMQLVARFRLAAEEMSTVAESAPHSPGASHDVPVLPRRSFGPALTHNPNPSD